MEELRSTEILDKEIQLDARRKAERLLKKTDADCARITADVDVRIEKMRAEKTAFYAKKIENYNKDADAAVPLEKQRALVSFIDISVHSALDSYLAALSPEKRAGLFSGMIAGYKNVLNQTPVNVVCSGIDDVSAKKLVEKVLGAHSVVSCTPAADAGLAEGLILETEDKGIRCRATLDEIRNSLLMKYRFELQDALLGWRLPQ